MTGFRDVYLPDRLKGFPWTSSPRFNTTITAVANGDEHRNQNWINPLHRFRAPEGVRCHEDIEELRDHWLIMAGPLYTFPIRDPLDFASRALVKPNLEPVIFSTDQVLGIGDGVETVFQLQKKYDRGGYDYTRPIYFPVVESVLLAGNALPLSTAAPTLPGGPYTADVVRVGGEVIFDHPPAVGVILTAGFYFDVEVRFEADDAMDAIVQAFQTSGFADLSFWEVRFCPGGVAS